MVASGLDHGVRYRLVFMEELSRVGDALEQ
jgi:hypothetical protein